MVWELERGWPSAGVLQWPPQSRLAQALPSALQWGWESAPASVGSWASVQALALALRSALLLE